MKSYSLYTLKWTGEEKPTLPSIAEKLGIQLSDLNPEFSAVCVDPDKAVYCVMIDQFVLDKIQPNAASGPFSNPSIEPFDIQ